MEKHAAKHKTVGLALGGGAAKGIAHIGVIKALEKAGIGIDYISGTSMGALVGGYYAATGDIIGLEKIMLNIKRKDIFSLKDIIKKRSGAFFRGDNIAEKLKEELGNFKIEDCKIPFVAIATDVKNGDEVRLKSGSLIDAIRASIAVPIIFSPVEVDGKLLMDGGLVNPVPADAAKELGAEFVVAVDVSSRWLETPEEMLNIKDMYSVIDQSFSVLECQLAKNILKESADIVIKPPVVHHEWFEFGDSANLVKTGESETELYISEIRKKTGHKKPFETFSEKFLDFILNKPH
ncbi:MAG: patatin-like phospholipase family protein [Candidatus Azambacteria bacterium]|nr:patatin-like phospholipase family protein [Candidatus Azambacteria bacterium]